MAPRVRPGVRCSRNMAGRSSRVGPAVEGETSMRQQRCAWCNGLYHDKGWQQEVCRECAQKAEELARELGRPAGREEVMAARKANGDFASC